MGIEPTWDSLHCPTPDLKSGSPTSELSTSVLVEKSRPMLRPDIGVVNGTYGVDGVLEFWSNGKNKGWNLKT
jgi:hypothetical protein